MMSNAARLFAENFNARRDLIAHLLKNKTGPLKSMNLNIYNIMLRH